MLIPTAATVVLGLALATGAGAQVGVIDTARVRWVHHALYAAAVASVGAAVVTAESTLRFLPAAVALGGLATTRGRTRRHAATAGVVALCWIAALPGGTRRAAR